MRIYRLLFEGMTCYVTTEHLNEAEAQCAANGRCPPTVVRVLEVPAAEAERLLHPRQRSYGDGDRRNVR